MSEDATKIEKLTTLRVKTNQKTNDTQNETEDYKAVATTQTNNPQPEISKHCVSRVNINIARQEECAPNEEHPTMTNTQLEATMI